jgi:hypothetical protein
MKVYHGSYTAIDKIDFNRCEVGKDFGRGFYVTNLRKQAEIWATRKGKPKRTTGVVTEFDFDENIPEVMELKVLKFEDYDEKWLDFVVLNRKNNSLKQQAHDYDIIEGPVADDRITEQIDYYIDGIISKEEFLNDLIHLPSHQICFCTVQSLQALTLSKPIINRNIHIIGSNILQALMTDYGLNEMEATDKYYTSNTYAQLANETTEFYKKDWTEIYELLKQELKHDGNNDL